MLSCRTESAGYGDTQVSAIEPGSRPSTGCSRQPFELQLPIRLTLRGLAVVCEERLVGQLFQALRSYRGRS